MIIPNIKSNTTVCATGVQTTNSVKTNSGVSIFREIFTKVSNPATVSRLLVVMIFAAGFGKRLKPLTDHTPKPLISLGSTTCLDLIIKRLKESGIQKIVINTHHLANQIHDHLRQYSDIIVSYEKEILETGGGLLKVLHYFDNKPFCIGVVRACTPLLKKLLV